MKRNSRLFLFGSLIVGVGTLAVLPILWPQLAGKDKDYDRDGLIFIIALIVVANIGLFIATMVARRKEAAVMRAVEPWRMLGAKPGEPEAFVRFDYAHSFPHVIWVSSVSYDSESPDGFLYKMFAIRREPELVIDLLLLRETVGGPKRGVFQAEVPIDKLSTVEGVLREIEKDHNVSFKRFDLADVRSSEDFRARALEAGWEEAHVE